MNGSMLASSMAWQVVVMLLAVGVLVKATDVVVRGLDELIRVTKWGRFGVAVGLMAVTTSLPELFVGISSALEGASTLSLGNVIGSNIANLSLVIGGAVLVGGSVAVVGNYAREDLVYTFLVGSLPLLLLMDKNLGRVEGLLLLVVYGVYLWLVSKGKPRKMLEWDVREMTRSALRRMGNRETTRPLAWVLVGMVVVVVASEVVVDMGLVLAQGFGVPILLVGIFGLAVGSSLPELVLWLKAAMKGDAVLIFGSLLGSVVTNSTLVIGVTALVSPIKVQAIDSYLVATLAYIIVFWLFWLLTKTKRRLDRWEGMVLILVYLMLLVVELTKSGYGIEVWKGLMSWIIG